MAGLIRKMLRAAVAQPWDYMGEGFPNEWEFRVDPQGGSFAVWDPDYDRWLVYDRDRPDRITHEVKPQNTDRRLGDWTPYLEVLEDD